MLRNKSTSQTYLVVLFTLYLKEDVNEDGSLKPAALASHKHPEGEVVEDAGEAADAKVDGKALEEAREKLEGLEVKENGAKGAQNGEDDLD